MPLPQHKQAGATAPSSDAEASQPLSAALLWDAERLNDPHRAGDKGARVQAMFDAIAPSYERVNAVLSAGQDAAWRRRVVAMARVKPDDVLLDIACGTGDVTRAFVQAAVSPKEVVALDFAAGMLGQAARRGTPRTLWVRGDAQALPLASQSVDITTIAFGLRNLQSPRQGIAEMVRVLRPGGRCLVLEFGIPRQWLLRRLYLAYFTQCLPRIATWISGDRTGAYRYLPASVLTFLDSADVEQMMRESGLINVRSAALTGGIAYIASGEKAG